MGPPPQPGMMLVDVNGDGIPDVWQPVGAAPTMQVQPVPMRVPPPARNVIHVQVPAGVSPGQIFNFRLPNGGAGSTQCPPGAGPGSAVPVQVPPLLMQQMGPPPQPGMMLVDVNGDGIPDVWQPVGAAQPMQVQPVPMQRSNVCNVQVPAGVGPGQLFTFRFSNGSLSNTQVPVGAGPGAVIPVQMPPAHPSQPPMTPPYVPHHPP